MGCSEAISDATDGLDSFGGMTWADSWRRAFGGCGEGMGAWFVVNP
jgi:hypothetical protein